MFANQAVLGSTAETGGLLAAAHANYLQRTRKEATE